MYSGGLGLSIDIHFVDIELSYDVLSPLPIVLSKHFNHPHPYIEIATAISDIAAYTGNLSSIPPTTTNINHLSINYLKSVLLYYNLPTMGTKDQLVLRTYLLRHNRVDDIQCSSKGREPTEGSY